ncbi:hypothetical protein TNCV_4288421 [Trichonephila clavipes]|nr:hypothetical protein TNCV_4288421 [Trichonephila clavipes]
MFSIWCDVKVWRVRCLLRCNPRHLFPRFKNTSPQGRSYHHINDMGLPSYRAPNTCNCSPTNKDSMSKEGPRRNLDIRPTQS